MIRRIEDEQETFVGRINGIVLIALGFDPHRSGHRKHQLHVTEQFKPYIGGGLAYIKGEISASLFGVSVSGDDSDFGFWASGGAVVTFAQRFNIGLDFRYSQAEITIEGVDGEAGGTHILGFVGFHF